MKVLTNKGEIVEGIEILEGDEAVISALEDFAFKFLYHSTRYQELAAEIFAAFKIEKRASKTASESQAAGKTPDPLPGA